MLVMACVRVHLPMMQQMKIMKLSFRIWTVRVTLPHGLVNAYNSPNQLQKILIQTIEHSILTKKFHFDACKQPYLYGYEIQKNYLPTVINPLD